MTSSMETWEDGVNGPHCIGEMECVPGLGMDGKRSKVFFRQLSRGLGHMEILCFDINKLSNLELWCCSPMSIHQTLVAVLCCCNFVTEFMVEFIQIDSKFSGTSQSHFAFRVHCTLVHKEG